MGSESATKSRETKRAASTQELMSNIMSPGAGEISKRREKELQDAINKGRGVEFVQGKAPVVGNAFQYKTKTDPETGEKIQVKVPVFNTNARATDYTGRIIAPAPTFGEMMGDVGRAIGGGQAKDPDYLRQGVSSAPGTTTTDYMKYAPKPERVKGIIPAIGEKVMDIAGQGGLVGMAMNSVLGKDQLTEAQKKRERYQKMSNSEKLAAGAKEYATLLGGQRNQKGGLIK